MHILISNAGTLLTNAYLHRTKIKGHTTGEQEENVQKQELKKPVNKHSQCSYECRFVTKGIYKLSPQYDTYTIMSEAHAESKDQRKKHTQ